MGRFDIALNKKKPFIQKVINKIKEKSPNKKPISRDRTQGAPGVAGFQGGLVGIQGETSTQGYGYTGTQGYNGPYFEHTGIQPRWMREQIRQQMEAPDGVVTHSGDSMIARGPTSRHLMIAGPDGHRIIIPLRSLNYTIQGDTLVVNLPHGQAEVLRSDIQNGMQRTL